MKTRGYEESNELVDPDKGRKGKARRRKNNKAHRRQELEDLRRLVGPLLQGRTLQQTSFKDRRSINKVPQRIPPFSDPKIEAGHHVAHLERSYSCPPQPQHKVAPCPVMHESSENYHDSPLRIEYGSIQDASLSINDPLAPSSPQTIPVDFAANIPDKCENCKVNIAEIERTSSFQFPFWCPICQHSRSPRSLIPLQQQSAASSSIGTSTSPAAEQESLTSCVTATDSTASPEWRSYRSHLTPTQRGVRPSDRYRPMYSDYEHRPSDRSHTDLSERWLHDRYTESVRKEQGFQGQGLDGESRGNRRH